MNELEELANKLSTMSPEEYDHMTDMFEASLQAMGQLDESNEFPVKHVFGDGIYQRVFSIPAGSMLTSKIHLTRHPWVLHCGAMFIISHNRADFVAAPSYGMTEPGTRRIGLAVADCVWSTFHANPDNEDVDKIEDRIILKRKNLLLEEKIWHGSQQESLGV